MKFSYTDIGKGKTIIFVHSYLWDKEMWQPQLDFFKNNFRCIAIDLPGHGNSSFNNISSLNDLAREIKNFIESLNIDNYIYVGLSVGGMLAPYLYNIDKDKISKLIIMDSFSGDEPIEMKQLYFSMLDTIEKEEKISEELANKIAPIFFSPQIDKNSQLYLNFFKKLKGFSKDNLKYIVPFGRIIFGRENSLEFLKNIQVPTYFITGEFDIPRPFHEAELMSKYVANSKLIKISKAGHISNLENSYETNKILFNIFNS